MAPDLSVVDQRGVTLGLGTLHHVLLVRVSKAVQVKQELEGKQHSITTH